MWLPAQITFSDIAEAEHLSTHLQPVWPVSMARCRGICRCIGDATFAHCSLHCNRHVAEQDSDEHALTSAQSTCRCARAGLQDCTGRQCRGAHASNAAAGNICARGLAPCKSLSMACPVPDSLPSMSPWIWCSQHTSLVALNPISSYFCWVAHCL